MAEQRHISFAQSPDLSEREWLRFHIEAGGVPLDISVDQERIHAAVVLPVFYDRLAYQPAWTNRQGLLPQAKALLAAIDKSDREGMQSPPPGT